MTIDEEFTTLLDEHYRIVQRTKSRKDADEYKRRMLDVCRRILANRQHGGKEQGAHYWARQVRYWEKEA